MIRQIGVYVARRELSVRFDREPLAEARGYRDVAAPQAVP